jgi:hypothetical protein
MGGVQLCRCELSKVLHAPCQTSLISCGETRQQQCPYATVGQLPTYSFDFAVSDFLVQ